MHVESHLSAAGKAQPNQWHLWLYASWSWKWREPSRISSQARESWVWLLKFFPLFFPSLFYSAVIPCVLSLGSLIENRNRDWFCSLSVLLYNHNGKIKGVATLVWEPACPGGSMHGEADFCCEDKQHGGTDPLDWSRAAVPLGNNGENIGVAPKAKGLSMPHCSWELCQSLRNMHAELYCFWRFFFSENLAWGTANSQRQLGRIMATVAQKNPFQIKKGTNSSCSIWRTYALD